ncbi:ABC transporter permease [Geodermatophilus sp. DF01_2]|uniref:ABC transporter permease n=1 Tax=Geodermatophilus sp. DF01-2 TaxID=2559610 RepID=UPI00142FEFA5|nr:ABC transporter permease [Geodermatophilus sp. DF01_2]
MSRLLVRGGLVTLAVLTGLVLIAPVLVIIPMSFSDSSFLEFPPTDWSFRWYENFFSDPSWRASTLSSLKIAVLVTITAVILGTAAAFGLVRGRLRAKAAVAGLVIAPLIVPYVIVGLAVYAAALQVGLTQTTLGFVLVHTALGVPFVTVNVAASLASFDQRLEQAAMSLGASPLTTFLRVTLPIIAPGVAAGALFAFITSWDEVVVSLFLSGPELTTLPVQMWSGVRVAIDPTVTAVSSLLLLFTITAFAALGVARLIRNRRLARSHR